MSSLQEIKKMDVESQENVTSDKCRFSKAERKVGFRYGHPTLSSLGLMRVDDHRLGRASLSAGT